MSVPCEVAVKCVLPVVRAMIAKELIEKHRMKQAQTAELLRVSQPAISLYCRKLRGKAIDLEQDHDVTNLIHKVTETLAKNKLTHRELVQAYCNICRTVRAKGLLCQMHRRFDTAVDPEKCELCKSSGSLTCI
jgi:predicted transcriptional regulator